MWAKNLFNSGMQCLTWQCLPRLWTCRASHRVLRLDMSLTLNQCTRSASTRLLKECSIYVICQLSVNVERAGSRSAASPLGQGCDLDSRTIVPRRNEITGIRHGDTRKNFHNKLSKRGSIGFHQPIRLSAYASSMRRGGEIADRKQTCEMIVICMTQIAA